MPMGMAMDTLCQAFSEDELAVILKFITKANATATQVIADKITEPGAHEVIEGNLADLATCQNVCAGMDTVVHLAADASTTADFYASLLDNNIKAAYNIFRAAKDQHCQSRHF